MENQVDFLAVLQEIAGETDDGCGDGELVKGNTIHKDKARTLAVEELGFAAFEIGRIEFFLAVESTFNVVPGQKIPQSSAQYRAPAPHLGVLVFYHLIGRALELDGHAGLQIIEG